ncbi:unnamed protein product [Linum trigynum]|uniref:Chromo domain-containing protein n=1 Tax=Linum trigynum TaxID=586398 RepID=A0AAV2CWX1_9ROSI
MLTFPPTFHISLPKHYRGSADRVETTTPPVSVDGDLELTPLKVLEMHWTKKKGRLIEESLVQWKHVEPEDGTWDETSALQKKYPTFDLEGKVDSKEGGDDRNPPQRVN